MALGNLEQVQVGLFDEKTQLKKSHATVPLMAKKIDIANNTFFCTEGFEITDKKEVE